eukprot:8093849-Pyramimonas_sp.AAC.1
MDALGTILQTSCPDACTRHDARPINALLIAQFVAPPTKRSPNNAAACLRERRTPDVTFSAQTESRPGAMATKFSRWSEGSDASRLSRWGSEG